MLTRIVVALVLAPAFIAALTIWPLLKKALHK